MVGNDGLLGVALFMGGETMPNRAIVQSAGEAFRLSGEIVKDEFARGGAVQRLFLRYTHGSSRRWRRRPSATGITRFRSSSAAGCY